jgi:hypothetical protein
MNQLPILLPVCLQHHQNLLHLPALLLLLAMPLWLPLVSACTAVLPPAVYLFDCRLLLLLLLP